MLFDIEILALFILSLARTMILSVIRLSSGEIEIEIFALFIFSLARTMTQSDRWSVKHGFPAEKSRGYLA